MNIQKHIHELTKGFTLIELLVVIAIIGILGTIASTSLGGSRGKAVDVQALASLRQIASVLEQDQVTAMVYVDASGADDDSSWTALLAGLPVEQAAQMPQSGNGYSAESAAAGYCLWKVSRQDDTKTIYCETGVKCSDKEGVDTLTALPAGCTHPTPTP